jgi:hypothetical protein
MADQDNKIDNPRVEVTFSYNLPDEYLHQTDVLKKTAEWTYKGPEHLYIFVDKATNKISSRFHYTLRDDGHLVPCPEDMTKVELDAKINPDIASLIHNEYVYGDLPHTVENLPDGTTYGVPIPVPPDHCYELTEIVYDPVKNEFVKPYAWKQPHMDWETLLGARNALLKGSDVPYANAEGTEKEAWATYRQKLRDVPTTFAGIDPWKITWPVQPSDGSIKIATNIPPGQNPVPEGTGGLAPSNKGTPINSTPAGS